MCQTSVVFHARPIARGKCEHIWQSQPASHSGSEPTGLLKSRQNEKIGSKDSGRMRCHENPRRSVTACDEAGSVKQVGDM